jgi:hypothetical protein
VGSPRASSRDAEWLLLIVLGGALGCCLSLGIQWLCNNRAPAPARYPSPSSLGAPALGLTSPPASLAGGHRGEAGVAPSMAFAGSGHHPAFSPLSSPSCHAASGHAHAPCKSDGSLPKDPTPSWQLFTPRGTAAGAYEPLSGAAAYEDAHLDCMPSPYLASQRIAAVSCANGTGEHEGGGGARPEYSSSRGEAYATGGYTARREPLALLPPALAPSACRAHPASTHAEQRTPPAHSSGSPPRSPPRTPMHAGVPLEMFSPRTAQLPAPLEQHVAGGQRSLQGATADGGWQCLTFLPSVEALRYDSSTPTGQPRLKLHIRAVPYARWDALARAATMGEWQSAVQHLLGEAKRELRATELL